MGVMLAAGPVTPVLALVSYSDAWKSQTETQDRLIQSQRDEISRLSAICTEKAALIEELRAAIAALEASNTAAVAKIRERRRNSWIYLMAGSTSSTSFAVVSGAR